MSTLRYWTNQGSKAYFVPVTVDFVCECLKGLRVSVPSGRLPEHVTSYKMRCDESGRDYRVVGGIVLLGKPEDVTADGSDDNSDDNSDDDDDD